MIQGLRVHRIITATVPTARMLSGIFPNRNVRRLARRGVPDFEHPLHRDFPNAAELEGEPDRLDVQRHALWSRIRTRTGAGAPTSATALSRKTWLLSPALAPAEVAFGCAGDLGDSAQLQALEGRSFGSWAPRDCA
jgi:hypothetical protein